MEKVLNDRAETPAIKMRSCLKCEASFASQWAGERVCSNCKHSLAWRSSGMPGTSFGSGGRRK